MLFLIPSWYKTNEWKEFEKIWYKSREHSETDDTVKQVQLFHRNAICDYRILLLSYAPNFRHFLHRQSMYRANYWSVFDSIQCVKKTKQSLISFRDLKWPKNIEFLYSQFSIIAMLNNIKYAQVEFGEYGNMIQVDLYKNGVLYRQNFYDDRGFISCTSVYENGVKKYDQYLDENGLWKLCEFDDGAVLVNPKNCNYLIGDNSYHFSKEEYESIEQVIEEVFNTYISNTNDCDIFCIAADNQHSNLLNRSLKNKKTIYSLFLDREIKNESLANASCILTDSEMNFNKVKNDELLKDKYIVNIPPYDTRKDYGISQQMHVQKILVPLDSLPEERFTKIIINLAKYMENNEDARAHIFTRVSAYNQEDLILEFVRKVLSDNGFPVQWARKENKNSFEIIPEGDETPIKFIVEKCNDDISINKCMKQQRLLLDLADKPDLFLQISCISMGIPQILANENQYMKDGRNGRVNRDIDNLQEDLSFYLESLNNWNSAMIEAYAIGKEHTNEELIQQWIEVLNYVERS